MTRNLLQYPIEKEEVCDLLARFYHEASRDQGVGGLDAYIIDRLLTVIKREFRHEDFNPDFTKLVGTDGICQESDTDPGDWTLPS